MKDLRKLIPLLLFYSLMTYNACAQEHGHQLQSENFDVTEIFGLLEIPFLFLCIFFAFKTATSMKGGAFGKGMALLAWGFLVMAIGHFHMQLDHFFGLNMLNKMLGKNGGSVVWFIALFATWGLSGLGFYKIYRASKGA